jgi:gamma-glutamyltranspeptidase/glutathione hydrolase
MNFKAKHFLFITLICFLVSCKKSENRQAQYQSKRGTVTSSAMVVSARAEASKIGSDILQKGGNAFDAMMATEMALAITYPYAGNLGGGGFMVYRLANGDIGSLDYREKAPLGATKDMFLDEHGNIIENKSTLGPLAVGVPGTIAGIFAAHEKFGTLPVKEILQPVIDLANRGFVITEKQQKRFNVNDSIFRVANGKQILHSNQSKAGDTLENPKLAETLIRIAQNGKDEFYKGKTAEILINFLKDKGGIIT